MIPTLILSQNYISSVKVRQPYLIIEDEQKEKGHTKSKTLETKSKTLENKVLSLSWKVTGDTTSCPIEPWEHPHTLWKDIVGIGRLVVRQWPAKSWCHSLTQHSRWSLKLNVWCPSLAPEDMFFLSNSFTCYLLMKQCQLRTCRFLEGLAHSTLLGCNTLPLPAAGQAPHAGNYSAVDLQ